MPNSSLTFPNVYGRFVRGSGVRTQSFNLIGRIRDIDRGATWKSGNLVTILLGNPAIYIIGKSSDLPETHKREKLFVAPF